MTKRSCLSLLSAVFLLLSIACSCDSGKQYKAMGATPAEKIDNISSDVEAMNWDGPKAMLKVKVMDQISRVKNGMKKGVITDGEAEEIIVLIEALSTKISKMENNMNNRQGGMGGPPGGGMGGPPGGGMGGPPGGGMGKPPEGMGEPSDGYGKGRDLMEFVQLKALINDLYSNTVTVSAETPTKEDTPETEK
jgi:hypothetical protein